MTGWIWWAIGAFGISGTILVIIGFAIGWPILIQFFIGTKIGRICLVIGAAILTAFGIYAKGQAAGRAAERARPKALTAKEVANAAAERVRIDALTDAQVDAELAQWSRKE